jgi:dolichol-phosphate mannosyltransferase
MFYNHTVAVVIPAYRVEKWIAEVITNLPGFVDRVFVVDDASPDNLSQVVSDLNSPKIKLIRHEKNLGGPGGATKTGFRQAIEEDIDLVVKMDGDNQMDPKYLPGLLLPLVKNECDYTKGNRFSIVTDISNMPVIRRIGNLLLSLATKVVSGYWHVVDSQNGFFAIKGKVLKNIKLDWLDNSYFFENSMLINLNIIEAKVSDVYIPARYLDEVSSMNILNILFRFPYKLIKGLFGRIFFRYFYRDLSPVFVMLILGLTLLGGGGGVGCFAWYQSVFHKIDMSIGTFALGLIPILLGAQLLLNALILDIQQSPTGTHKRYDFSEKELKQIVDNNQSELPNR